MKVLPPEVKEVLSRLRKMRIGDTLIIFCDETEEEVKGIAHRALKKGETVVWEDGRTQWIDDDVIFDFDRAKAEGESAGYTWTSDGNRVAFDRFLCTKSKDGEVTKERQRRVYKDFLSV